MYCVMDEGELGMELERVENPRRAEAEGHCNKGRSVQMSSLELGHAGALPMLAPSLREVNNAFTSYYSTVVLEKSPCSPDSRLFPN